MKSIVENWNNFLAESDKKDENAVRDAIGEEGGAAGTKKIAQMPNLSQAKVKKIVKASDDMAFHPRGDAISAGGSIQIAEGEEEEYGVVMVEGKICAKGKAWAMRKYGKWSAYAAMGASRYCKEPGWGKGKKKKTKKKKKKRRKKRKKTNEEIIEGALKNWVKQNWTKSDGSPCGNKKKQKNPRRCKPASKWRTMSKGEKKADNAKKKRGGRKGKQFVSATKKGKVTRSHSKQPRKRKRSKKNESMLSLTQNWNTFLEEGFFSDFMDDALAGKTVEPATDDSTFSATGGSHVEEAIREKNIFGNGSLKEQDPKSWTHIAKYWDHIGSTRLAKGTRDGYYAKNQPNKWHWSAAFIQYCMRNNKEFQKLQNKSSGKGNHRYYWLDALKNTEILLGGGTLEPLDWIMIDMKQASDIGYTESVGDISMQGKLDKSRLHGDIVTPEGKIGGNLGNSCKVTTAKTIYIVTQSPQVKRRLLNRRS